MGLVPKKQEGICYTRKTTMGASIDAFPPIPDYTQFYANLPTFIDR